MASLDSTLPSANGHTTNRIRLTRPVRKALTGAGRSQRIRKAITVALGCGIPCLSLALSSIGGRLLQASNYVLGIGFMGLCCTVLAVSLSHLAWAVRDITKSERWQAVALAVSIDLSIVAGELAGVSGYDSWVVSAVMVCVTGVSAVLNVWAFTPGRPAMRHNRTLETFVRLSNWSRNYKVGPLALADLITLATRAHGAGTRECNTGKSADPQRHAFEKCAAEYGFSVEWNGLWPSMKVGDVYVELPSID